MENYIIETKKEANYMVDTGAKPQGGRPQPGKPQNNKATQPKQENAIGAVSDYIDSYKYTKKAEYLYKNGFVGETVQMEVIENATEVTFKNGFKGFGVYVTNDGQLLIAKAESEEGAVYSYYVTFLDNISDEQYNDLVEIKSSKLNVVTIAKYLTLVVAVIGFVLTILSIATDLANGAEFIVALVGSSLTLLFSGMLAGLAGLLFKK